MIFMERSVVNVHKSSSHISECSSECSVNDTENVHFIESVLLVLFSPSSSLHRNVIGARSEIF